MTILYLWALATFTLLHNSISINSQSNIEFSRSGLILTSDLGQKDVDSRKSGILRVQGKSGKAVQEVFSKYLSEWNIILGNDAQKAAIKGSYALISERRQLATHLHQVLDIAGALVHIAQSCENEHGGSQAEPLGTRPCLMMAPELQQGGTLTFLASLLHNYPRGPKNDIEFKAWASAATAFLQEYYRRQKLQRNVTKQAADAAADIAAFNVATRAAEREARKNATGTDAAEVSHQHDGSGGDSSSADVEYATDGLMDSLRTLKAAGQPRGVGGSISNSSRNKTGGNGGGSPEGSSNGVSSSSVSGGSGNNNSNSNMVGNNTDAFYSDGGDREDEDRDGIDEGDGGKDGASLDFSNILGWPGLTRPPEIPSNFTGAQYGGLPLIRRVLLAQLLLGWMEAIHQKVPDVSSVADDDLAQIVALIYKIHVESVAQRAVMEYFHISKTGGTSWTSASSISGCRRPLANAARLRHFDDDCRWINGTLLRQHGINVRRKGIMQVCSRFDVTERQTTIRDCVSRLRLALENGFQYISNEYTLHGGLQSMYGTHICPQFVNVISIREPLERLASNIKYMLVRLRATLFRKPPAAELFSSLFCNAPFGKWEVYSPAVADNYNIRTLVGEREFHAPLYSIGEAHEAVAKRLLLQYDLVLDLNSGDSAADLIMREGLGWEKTLAEVRIWTVERLAKRTGMDLEEACRVGDLKPLFKRQVYDQRWYSFGRVLSRLDQMFLSAASHLGLKPWPEDWAQVLWSQQTEDGNTAAKAGGATATTGGATPAAAAGVSPNYERHGHCGLLGATQLLRHGPTNVTRSDDR